MVQHYPYIALPKTYYYFRPYNWFHIGGQQQEVTLYGGSPYHPYDNRFFQNIYQSMEQQWPIQQPINRSGPGAPEALPAETIPAPPYQGNAGTGNSSFSSYFSTEPRYVAPVSSQHAVQRSTTRSP